MKGTKLHLVYASLCLVLCLLLIFQWVISRGSKDLEERDQSHNQHSIDLSSCTRLPPKPPSSNPVDFSLIPMLEDGQELLQLHLESESVTNGVFIMGNSNAGKATVTQIIAGNLSRLHSVLDESDNMVIVDDDATIRQLSLYPEFVHDNETGNVYIDFPGFDDTQNAEMDIAATFFKKTVTDNLSKVKLLFVVKFSSVRLGSDVIEFDQTVSHAIKFVSNITELAPSIGLVVTKVESYQSGVRYTDDLFMNETVEYLRSYVQSQYEYLARDNLPPNSREYITVLRKIEFINGILVDDPDTEEEQFPKISFVRNPEICGSLYKILSVTESKERLQSLVKHLNFTDIKQGDFGYTVKAGTVPKVQEYAGVIGDQISEILRNSLSELQSFHYKKVKSLIYREVFDEISNDYGFLRSLIAEEHTNRDDFFQKVEALFLQMQATELLANFQRNVAKLLNYLDFFDTVSGLVFNNGIPKWQIEIDPFAEQLNLLRNWFKHVITICSSYEFQAKTPKPFNSSWPDYKVLNYLSDIIPNFVVPTSFPSVFQNYREVMVGLLKYYSMPVASFVSSDKVMFYSTFIKTSSLQYLSSLQSSKSIYIFAFEKLYIDSDLNLQGKGTKVFIIAPVWEMVGNRLITLDGENGASVSPAKAKSGTDGRAGNKGSNAGSMFGIADTMTGGKLTISAVGGAGSDGQDGGDGGSGQNGQSFSESLFPLCHWQTPLPADFTVGSSRYTLTRGSDNKFIVNGEPGTAGGNGGKGGQAGESGRGGQLHLLVGETNNGPHFQKRVGDGKLGRHGQGGRGGVGGTYGKGMICEWYLSLFTCKWKNCNSIPPTRPRANDGQSGCNGCSILGKQTNDGPLVIKDQEKASSIKLFNEKAKEIGLPEKAIQYLVMVSGSE